MVVPILLPIKVIDYIINLVVPFYCQSVIVNDIQY